MKKRIEGYTVLNDNDLKKILDEHCWIGGMLFDLPTVKKLRKGNRKWKTVRVRIDVDVRKVRA